MKNAVCRILLWERQMLSQQKTVLTLILRDCVHKHGMFGYLAFWRQFWASSLDVIWHVDCFKPYECRNEEGEARKGRWLIEGLSQVVEFYTIFYARLWLNKIANLWKRLHQWDWSVVQASCIPHSNQQKHKATLSLTYYWRILQSLAKQTLDISYWIANIQRDASS